ncbi:solute carrier organic anion transporter family member 4C1-like [Clavelina lepadiformis]|uniref:solute carrier organic anion transporter family member 4C1-like n=1 Tax=Clavelina lepadiformis TaxID=159417 RepID=UPI00404304B5
MSANFEQPEANRKEKRRNDSDVTSSSLLEEDLGRCGWGKFTPDALQCCNSPKGFLVVYCFLVIVQGMLVNGFVNVSISTLEKRFGLNSSETGVVSTGYDIAFCVLTMFVTYFGARSHRPRMVAIGSFIMGLGAMVFWLPHFTTGNYEYADGFSDTCSPESDLKCSTTGNNLHDYLYVFILGQLLHGVGATPLYTLGLSFIEDSVAKESAPVYIGIGNAASIFGPVIGYGLGGVVLGIYVDIDSVDMSTINLTSSDPRWIGAWWIGIMISMACAWMLTLPLFAFPKEFPSTARYRAMRQSEVHNDGADKIASQENFANSFKDFPAALLMLFKNPTYLFTCLAGCTEAMLISGFTTFLPKIIENEFQQTAGTAAIVAGVISIPGGVVGHVAAGIIIKRFNLKTASILKFCVCCCVCVVVGAPVVLLYCRNMPVAGITYPYSNHVEAGGLLTSGCNNNCSCQEEFFIPVCGADNINYFTACHAGCLNSSYVENGTTYYTDCACIATNLTDPWEAREGSCDSNCNTLPAFLGVFFVVVMFTFMSSTPALVVTFRVVPASMRSFALGVQWLFIRALGSIPGPIMFGSIIDLTCILWQEKQCEGTRGNCWIYDSTNMATNVIIISIVCKIASIILFSLSCWFYKPPIQPDQKQTQEKSSGTANGAYEIESPVMKTLTNGKSNEADSGLNVKYDISLSTPSEDLVTEL